MTQDEVRWATVKAQLEDKLAEFGRAVDDKAFDALSEVFDPAAVGDYDGRRSHETSAVLIAAMHAHLGRMSECGATQHNVLNLRLLALDGDAARSLCNYYAVHQGVNAQAGRILSMWGSYQDDWRLTDQGWRIVHRRYTSLMADGPKAIVGQA